MLSKVSAFSPNGTAVHPSPLAYAIWEVGGVVISVSPGEPVPRLESRTVLLGGSRFQKMLPCSDLEYTNSSPYKLCTKK